MATIYTASTLPSVAAGTSLGGAGMVNPAMVTLCGAGALDIGVPVMRMPPLLTIWRSSPAEPMS